jgi:pilus assembly protein Flp/PilA
LWLIGTLTRDWFPMNRLFVRFARDESAATAIEYAVIAGFLSIVIVGAVHGLGVKVNAMFTSVSGLFG